MAATGTCAHLAWACLLLAGLCWGCGHHGQGSQATREAVQQHLQHKAVMRRLVRQGPTAAATSSRRALQEDSAATASQQLQQVLLLWSSSSDTVASPVPLRIHVEYQSTDLLQDTAQADLQAVASAVVKVIQSYLSARAPSQGPLLVVPKCVDSACSVLRPSFNNANPATDIILGSCGLARINPAHVLDVFSCNKTGSASCTSQATGQYGSVTDVYLYVTSVQDDQCNSGAAAWARPCMLDHVTNRPIMGTANVCPKALLAGRDALVPILTHEVIHALGFTGTMFDVFVDPASNQELTRAAVQATAEVNGRTVTLVRTTTVVREVRAQFGCSSLVGAQLEDEGGDGSANSHWEYTHFQGELMVASTQFAASGDAPRLSRMTLALMEDSGWYVGNWSQVGGPMQWGSNSGCVLPQQGCQAFIATTPAAAKQMFCPTNLAGSPQLGPRYSTSASLRSVGTCSSTGFSNGCGLVFAVGGQSSCQSMQFQYPNADVFGWDHGPTSRSYPITYKFVASINNGLTTYTYPATGSQGDQDAACFPTVCRGGAQYLEIVSRLVRCPTGQYVDLALAVPDVFRQGQVGPCPDEGLMCATLACGNQACSPAGGECYNGRCSCRLGWSGADCGFSLAGINASSLLPAPLPNSSPPPSPPTTHNVTTWVQMITLTLQLDNTSSAEVLLRSYAYTSTVAAWAGVDTAQVLILSAAVANISDTTTVSALQGNTGQASEGGRRRRVTSDTKATGGSRLLWRARLLLDVLHPATSGTSGPIQVVATIQPVTTQQTTAVMGKLADPAEQAQLLLLLRAAGFQEVAISLTYSLKIVQQTVSVPDDIPEDGAVTAPSITSNWMIIIIAASVAGGAVLLATIIVLIFRRRAIKHAKQLRADLMAAAAAARASKPRQPPSQKKAGVDKVSLPFPPVGPKHSLATTKKEGGEFGRRGSPAPEHSIPSAPTMFRMGDGYVEVQCNPLASSGPGPSRRLEFPPSVHLGDGYIEIRRTPMAVAAPVTVAVSVSGQAPVSQPVLVPGQAPAPQPVPRQGSASVRIPGRAPAPVAVPGQALVPIPGRAPAWRVPAPGEALLAPSGQVPPS